MAGKQIWRTITDDNVDASYSLAADEILMRGCAGGSEDQRVSTLRLCTYRSHFALVGQFQDIHAEIDLDECERLGVVVNRRPSGGGAIVVGKGQLGAALAVSPWSAGGLRHPAEIFARCAGAIIAGLRDWGVAASLEANNAIVVDDRKIGSAALCLDDREVVLFHANLLVDSDLALMSQLLGILRDKRPGQTVAVTTVMAEKWRQGQTDAVTTSIAREHIRQAFEREFDVTLRQEPFGRSESSRIEELRRMKYDTRKWIFDANPAGDAIGSSLAKTRGGLLRVYVSLTGQLLQRVMITGDFFGTARAIGRLEAALTWGPADPAEVAKAVAGVCAPDDPDAGIVGVSQTELSQAISQAVANARRQHASLVPRRLSQEALA